MDKITFEDFTKLDIRVGTILEAEAIEGADKVLKLVVDLGEEKRTIVAGVAEFYQPEDLIGKQVPVLVNLEPRTFRGVESQGMILAADDGKPVLLHPDKVIANGTKLR